MDVQIMAHRAGSRTRPNSLSAVQEVMMHEPNIIELDVRLSKDNQLVCYHGNILESFGLYSSTNFRTASELNVMGISCLQDLTSAINGRFDIFLDIKDYRIRWKQISSVFENARLPNTLHVGARSANYFRTFGEKPDHVKFCKIYSFGLNSSLWKYRTIGIDVVDLFPWMIGRRRIERIRSMGMDFSLSGLWEFSRQIETAVRFGTQWISVYDVPFYKQMLGSMA